MTAKEQIRQAIYDIAHPPHTLNRYPIMSGKVKSVDEVAGSCEVYLTVQGGDVELPEITLNAITGNTNGVIQYPAIGSHVWVAEIDGPGVWGIVMASDLQKETTRIESTTITIKGDEVLLEVGSSNVSIKDDIIKFNAGTNKGMVKVTELVARLQILEHDNNSLKTAFTTLLTALAATAAATPTTPVTAGAGIRRTYYR